MPTGFIIINKPSGPTSHDIIYKLRKITNIKKIGHAGTLDPFASGVLICAIGRQATKQISRFVKLDKEYIADIFLGAETDTYDREGVIQNEKTDLEKIPQEKIEDIFKQFIGEQKQTPPMFSAKKVKGKKLYQLARQGIEIEREAVDIVIYNLELIKYDWPQLIIKVKCSSGTYIRSLAFDIGRKLACGAYLKELQRTAIGDFRIEESVNLGELDEDNWKKKLIFNF